MFKVTQVFAFTPMFLLVFLTYNVAFADTKLNIKLVCENVSNETLANAGTGWEIIEQPMSSYEDLIINLQQNKCIPEASNITIFNQFSLLETEYHFYCVFQKITGDHQNNQEITISRYSGDTFWRIETGTFKMGLLREGFIIENKYKCTKNDRLF